MPSASQKSSFLGLPGEIREEIYHQILDFKKNKYMLEDQRSVYKFDLEIFRVNKQVYHEALRVFRRDNIFVAVQTPWEEAQEHVATDGYVPIVVKNDKADRFTDHYMTVKIDAPDYIMAESRFKFVTLIEDLPTFTQMWQYQDLTHRDYRDPTYKGLNKHLRLTLQLKYPYGAIYDEKPIPKAIQKQLMEPFGMIKDLRDVIVEGEHYQSIEKSMREAMLVPYKSAEDCLEETTILKDKGNAAYAKEDFKEALECYFDSFRAMHIICRGRLRQIWGDAYFHKVLSGGRYDKQEGQIVRLQLRVKLVANIVGAYLKLKEFEEAKFWGMRTISILREAMDHEDYVPGFVASDALGKIYFRTGLAEKALGDKDGARELLRVAEKYLPRDGKIKEELQSVALRLG